MPQAGFEPTIPVFERAKTVHASDRAATVIGSESICEVIVKPKCKWCNRKTRLQEDPLCKIRWGYSSELFMDINLNKKAHVTGLSDIPGRLLYGESCFTSSTPLQRYLTFTIADKKLRGFRKLCYLNHYTYLNMNRPITVPTRSKAWNIFACLNTGIVASNPTRGIDVCQRFFHVCVVLCL
jgi:hypothetical protein